MTLLIADRVKEAGGIYTITAPSGNQYVGSAVNIKARWRGHLRDLKKGKHANAYLQNAWNKYGEVLIFKVIVVCSREDLLLFEQQAIDSLNPRYNIAKVAGSSLGIKRTPQQCKNISESKKGIQRGPMPEVVRAKIAKSSFGKVMSVEACEKMRFAKEGIQQSREFVEKRVSSLRGRTHSAETILNAKVGKIRNKVKRCIVALGAFESDGVLQWPC